VKAGILLFIKRVYSVCEILRAGSFGKPSELRPWFLKRNLVKGYKRLNS
jgi:hypothetical protein